MIPHTIVLEPALVIYKIYMGYWFFGRPTVEDLRQDLRSVTMKCRPDWDITTSELKAAWQARPQGTLLSVRQNIRSNPRGAGLGRVVRDLRMRRDQSLLEIGLNESRTGVDVDLTQDRVTGINEPLRACSRE